jgi:O-antigen ligase
MKVHPIIHVCFLVPFVLTTFNVQVFVTYLISEVLAQLIAYGNLGLLVLGMALIVKKRGTFSRTARLWIIFFLMYFAFAILASAVRFNPAQILISIVPFIYVLAFYLYLSIPENRELFKKVALVAFICSSLLSIYLFSINFDLDNAGIHIYQLDRAEGIYGDANNTALMSIISFIFVYKVFQPTTIILKLLKIALLGGMFYCLFITFSNTGFMVFIIAMLMLNYKFFTGIRMILGAAILPILYIILINLNSLTANMDLIGQQRDKINNIVNIVTFNTDKVDDSGRNELVQNLLNYIYESPFIGNGLDFAISKHGHNTIIGVWADAGIFTLLMFLFMLGKYFQRSIQSTPDVRYFILPMLLTFCIFMLSLQSIINQPYLIVLFLFMGYHIDENKEQTSI